MSADNGYILRKNDEGKFVLHEYNASSDEFPGVESDPIGEWNDLMDAVKAYQKMDEEALEHGYTLSEYGLTIRIYTS